MWESQSEDESESKNDDRKNCVRVFVRRLGLKETKKFITLF